MNQVTRPQVGDHAILLQQGILYLFAMTSSMNQVIRPQVGDHAILPQLGILYLFAITSSLNQVIKLGYRLEIMLFCCSMLFCICLR